MKQSKDGPLGMYWKRYGNQVNLNQGQWKTRPSLQVNFKLFKKGWEIFGKNVFNRNKTRKYLNRSFVRLKENNEWGIFLFGMYPERYVAKLR